jgi:DNA-directed RNA polymerase specialized sigma24 family protein
LVLDTELSGKIGGGDFDVLRVNEALEVLCSADKELGQLVELKFFGGLTETEIAEIQGTSERTVRRNWEKARLLLTAALQ